VRAKAATKFEQRKAYRAEYNRRNPDAFKQWLEKNRDRNKQRCHEYHKNNRERRAETYAAWAKANPDAINALIAKRTTAKKRAIPPWANPESHQGVLYRGAEAHEGNRRETRG
jgi:hypothetical protein